MTAITFNTLNFATKLEESGMPNKQANAISDAIHVMHTEADFATKTDLKELGKELRHEINNVELRLNGKIGVLQWMCGFSLAGTTTLIAKAFLPYLPL